jgi:hypothetical protein
MCVGPNAVSSSPVIVNTIRGPHSRMASVRDRQNLISPRCGLLAKLWLSLQNPCQLMYRIPIPVGTHQGSRSFGSGKRV